VPSGVLLLSPGLLVGLGQLAWAGAAVLAAGLGAHLVSLMAYVRHRRRKADLHLLFVVTSSLWLMAGAGLALAAVLVMGHHHHEGEALVAAAVVAFGGWLLEALVGHAHKVVPFIVWSALRSRGVEKGPSGKPLMFADLYDHRWAAVTYGLVTAGIAAVAVGFAVSSAGAIAVGGGLFVATGLIVAANLSITPNRLLAAGRGSVGTRGPDEQKLESA
jgi:hypothetical protein